MQRKLISVIFTLLLSFKLALIFSLTSCSLFSEDEGSLSFSITVPDRSATGSQLYYFVGVLHVPPQGIADDYGWDDFQGDKWKTRFSGAANELYALAYSEGTITEGVPSVISVKNIPSDNNAGMFIVLGEYENFFEDGMFLYRGGSGAGNMCPPATANKTFPIRAGSNNSVDIVMALEDLDEDDIYQLFFDFSGTTTDFKTVLEQDSEESDRYGIKYNVELRTEDGDDAFILAGRYGSFSTRNYRIKLETGGNEEWEGNLTANNLPSLAGKKVTGTILIYYSGSDTAASPNPLYKGTLSPTTVYRTGMIGLVKMEDY